MIIVSLTNVKNLTTVRLKPNLMVIPCATSGDPSIFGPVNGVEVRGSGGGVYLKSIDYPNTRQS